MLGAAEKVVRFTDGLNDVESFAADEKTVDAVIRNIQIIGEAARHIPSDVQARHPTIEWAGMRGMRNILVHDYAGILLDQVWAVVQYRIPGLIASLHTILKAESLPDDREPETHDAT